MNFIGNRNFRADPQTSLEGFICPQNSDKQQKIKVFGRSGGVKYQSFCVMSDKIRWLYLDGISYRSSLLAIFICK